jgi:fructosamine-3-kinase
MNVQEKLLREHIDPSLTDSALTQAVRKAGFEHADVKGYRVLTGGCWNRVIEVRKNTEGKRLVVKITPKKGSPGIQREYDILRLFAKETEMPVPEPYLADLSGEIIPGSFLVMERLAGGVMHHIIGALEWKDREKISTQIGNYVRTLHRKKSRGFGGAELPPEERQENWADFWLPRLDQVIEESAESGVIEQSLLNRVKQVRPRLRKYLDIGQKSTLTHYDIWSGNVMIERSSKENRVSGFIDVSGIYADYARELSFMLMFGLADDRMMAQYLDEHSLDDGFILRVNIYNLKMHLKHITMYPGQHYYRKGAEDCLEYIESHTG